MMPKSVILFNPPGKILIRGEARSDSETDPEISSAAAKWIYPPMNLAYGAACFRQHQFLPILRDYPAERKSLQDFEKEIIEYRPDIAVCNLNPSSEKEDMQVISIIRKHLPKSKMIGWAPYLTFYNISEISKVLLETFDALLVAEHPELLPDIANTLLNQNKNHLIKIPGVVYWDAETQTVMKTSYPLTGQLDHLPLPAQDLLNRQLYLRPDIGKPQALIQVGRGCPYQCAFCLAPPITKEGKGFTVRSVKSVMEEIKDCVFNYNIRNFFFRADTFTANKEWVREFCQSIIDNGLKISWCANSRVNTFDETSLPLMRRSGCWLLAFGFESGCQETLQRVNKGNTVEGNERVRKLCRKQGVRVLGQYMIGFPWEGKEEIAETFAHIRRMQCDFIDMQVLVPYRGTALYDEMQRNYPDLIDKKMGSKIQGGVLGTAKGLTKQDLIQYQKKMLRATYLSPASITRRLLGIRSFAEFRNYSRFGIKFLMNHFFKGIEA